MPEDNLRINIKKICFLVKSKCNLHCRTCDYSIIKRQCSDLSLEKIKKIIKSAKLDKVRNEECLPVFPELKPIYFKYKIIKHWTPIISMS
jgi:hypothetical protein